MIENRRVMGNNIQRHLDKIGMDRKEFARRMGFPYSSVTDWINGKTYPRIDKIEKMAAFFGVDKADLVEEGRPDKPAGLTPDELALVNLYRQLNETGKAVINTQIGMMVKEETYRKDTALNAKKAN